MVRIDLDRFKLLEGPGSQPAPLAEKLFAIDMSTYAAQVRFMGRYQSDDEINPQLHWMGQAERDSEVLLGWRGRVPFDAMDILGDKFEARSQNGEPDLAWAPAPPPAPPPPPCAFVGLIRVGVSTG